MSVFPNDDAEFLVAYDYNHGNTFEKSPMTSKYVESSLAKMARCLIHM